jgi:hypothetical protein
MMDESNYKYKIEPQTDPASGLDAKLQEIYQKVAQGNNRTLIDTKMRGDKGRQ